jgi:hypothetical protein
MCALCGTLGAGRWAEQGGRTARKARLELIARILGPFGLTVENRGGTAYHLRTAAGDLAVAYDLGSLWVTVERLLGRPLDPLDPAVLARVTSG